MTFSYLYSLSIWRKSCSFAVQNHADLPMLITLLLLVIAFGIKLSGKFLHKKKEEPDRDYDTLEDKKD